MVFHRLASVKSFNFLRKLQRSVVNCDFELVSLVKSRNYSGKIVNMEEKKRIAVCQMTSTHEKDKNMQIVAQLVADAAADKAEMVFLPEACDYLCDNKKDTVKNAEPIIGGNLVEKYCKLAKDHSVWLSLGGLHEKSDNDNKIYNTHVIIDNYGEIIQTYRKIHLFDVEIPEKSIRLKESDTALSGDHIVLPVSTSVGRVGLQICYDLRFPELSIQLSKFGADILTFPSAFTYATGQAHWEVLLRARAIENQCFVIAAAQIGHHNEKRRSYGHAMCVDPWGKIIATCGDKSDVPCYAIADLDYNRLEDVRKNMPVFSHKRNDVYNIYNQKVRKALPVEHTITASTESEESPEVNVVEDIDEDFLMFSNIKIRSSCIFYTTELCYAFVNIRCVVPGHVLVAPKRIAKRTEDLTPEEINDFFQVVVRVQKLMEIVHDTTSSTVTIQDGPAAGQTVEHVHCHIMPRHHGDFKDVDLIYLELANHDANHGRKATMPLKPPRELGEMQAEATMLRKQLEKLDWLKIFQSVD